MNREVFVGYAIIFLTTARKQLDKIPFDARSMLIGKIKLLQSNPSALDIKKLKGYEGLYRLRSGDYRIVYKIVSEKKTIYVGLIAHRSEVYRLIQALKGLDAFS